MISLDKKFENLIHEEGLDNIPALLEPRSLDEVPLFSRIRRIGFLSGFPVEKRSEILVIFAVKYLDRILNFIEGIGRNDLIVMLSILEWKNLQEKDGDPLYPNFWICTNIERDLIKFRLYPGVTDEALLVRSWLISANLFNNYEVFQEQNLPTSDELYRIYVARRDTPNLERVICKLSV